LKFDEPKTYLTLHKIKQFHDMAGTESIVEKSSLK